MEYRFKLLIMASVLLCLLLAGFAQANVVKKVYIDGNDVGQQTGTRALSYNFHRLTIAAEGDLNYRYNGLIGRLDEFAIYDKILSDPCIVAHANAVTPEDYNSLVAADGPILWLKFEDPCSANGYTAADSSGNGQNGTYIGDAEFGDVNLVAGFLGNAAELYGATDGNGTCIDVNDAAGALELQDLTVEFWLYSTDLYAAYERFFQHNGGNADANAYGAHMLNDEGNPMVGLIGGGSVEYDPVGADMNDGNWHHVVFTFDSTPDPNPDPNIGTYPEEVMQDSPVLYIRCEELPLVDYSDSNFWVEADSEVTVQKVPGSYGNCARLNAGWIAAANTTYEPCSPVDYSHDYAFGPNDLTVEMWLYYPPGTTVDGSAGLWNQNAGTDVATWSPGCSRSGGNGRLRCNDNRSGGDGYAYSWDGAAWATDQNNWHHYVMIYDVSEDPCTLHVEWWTDNERHKNSTYGTDVFDNYLGPEMDHILFGNYGSREEPDNVPYRQYIDEIAVYDKALSSDRIQAHYEAFFAKSCDEMWDRQLVGVQVPWALKVDRDMDCFISLADIAAFAEEWALCNDPAVGASGGCPPNW